ncbi:MAG TPA: hypothetical protein VJ837_01330, partial [Candidatus Paceibacterota bacterium]|nr:hypothetical protein [Candidatus Paceibacterota bacterium]
MASDLVEGDTNQVFDVFVHDTRTRETERVSVASDGSEGIDPEGQGFFPQMSGSSLTGHAGYGVQRALSHDGRFVAFVSRVSNLVPRDSNRLVPSPVTPQFTGRDIFVHDRHTGRTERVSVTSVGEETNYGISEFVLAPSLSRNGRFVAFLGRTRVDGPAPPSGAGHGRVLYDRRTGAAEMAAPTMRACRTCSPTGTMPEISSNGRFITYSANSDGHVRNDDDLAWDVFVRDRGDDVGAYRTIASHSSDQESDGQVCVSPDVCISPGGIGIFDGTGETKDHLNAVGVKIRNASLTYRPNEKDIFARLELDELAPRGSGNVYGFSFRARQTRFEVRAQEVPLRHRSTSSSRGASFNLFRCEPRRGCTSIQMLRGGYGTTGERVVLSIPI